MFFFSSRRRHTSCALVTEFRRVLFRSARRWEEFAKGLGCLPGRTAWASGEWDFGDGDRRHWKAIQNVHRDIITLAQYLIGVVRADVRARRAAPANGLPLLHPGED